MLLASEIAEFYYGCNRNLTPTCTGCFWALTASVQQGINLVKVSASLATVGFFMIKGSLARPPLREYEDVRSPRAITRLL